MQTTAPVTESHTAEPSLAHQWQTLLKKEPDLRIRHAASRLGVSEAELLATGCGRTVTRLRPDIEGLLGRLYQLGPVMALVRNAGAVHETMGSFGRAKGNRHVTLFLGEQDHRLFIRSWTRVLAEQGKERSSLQFFNQAGTACFKVFTTQASDQKAWDTLIQDFLHDDQSQVEPDVRTARPREFATSLAPDEQDRMRTRWDALKDVHDFNALLNEFHLNRCHAFRLAGVKRAHRAQPDCIEKLLHEAAARTLPLMTFVGNGDAIQIHTGKPQNLRRTGPWFNILDPAFSLHLNTEQIDQVWVVRRPTRDGVVTSVEAFDANEQNLVQFFGERHEGDCELTSWRTLVSEVCNA